MFELNELIFLILSSEIIKNIYIKQRDKEVSQILSLEPNFDWNIITDVDLSCLSIVHICNFNLVTNLKYLRLTQNKIQKIEKLDCLTKLEKLDLSYNKISKIENLEKLTALSFISLSGNNISKLENLDTISQLQTLFINNNNITDINELFYLLRFKNLRILNVLNNPATKNVTLADYEAIMKLKNVKFSSLKYFNARIVPDFMILLPDDESNHTSSQLQDDTNRKCHEILNDMNGEQFILNMIEVSNVGKILSTLNKNMRSDFLKYIKEITNCAIALNNIGLER